MECFGFCMVCLLMGSFFGMWLEHDAQKDQPRDSKGRFTKRTK